MLATLGGHAMRVTHRHSNRIDRPVRRIVASIVAVLATSGRAHAFFLDEVHNFEVRARAHTEAAVAADSSEPRTTPRRAVDRHAAVRRRAERHRAAGPLGVAEGQAGAAGHRESGHSVVLVDVLVELEVGVLELVEVEVVGGLVAGQRPVATGFFS